MKQTDNKFISQFKQWLTDCMTQRWHADITESSWCDTYKEFKSVLTFEKYLCIRMPFSLRKEFERIRCSGHKFDIELGRHRGIARAIRVSLFVLITISYLLLRMNIMYV